MKVLTFLVMLVLPFGSSIAASKVVNIYSFRESKLIKPLIDEFTRTTGIKVNIVSGKADKLMKRLIADGDNSFADLILTTNVARLEKAKQLGLLSKINSDYLTQNTPAEFRDTEGYWFGISTRARAIFYAKDSINPTDISSYQDLTDKKWRGQICSRKGSHIYNRAMVASFIANHGEQWTKTWLQGFVKNLAMRPNGGDRDQLRNIKKGNCQLALGNSYYYGMMSDSAKMQDREVYQHVGIIWPNQDNTGTHINISGAAIISSAKNKHNAQRFIEFLLMPKAQEMYSKINYEYPASTIAKPVEKLESWGAFTADRQGIKTLSKYLTRADTLIAGSGW